jgi:uncharacterized protein
MNLRSQSGVDAGVALYGDDCIVIRDSIMIKGMKLTRGEFVSAFVLASALIGGVAAVTVLGGWRQGLIAVSLIILEVSLSFDNAVINATVLRRMSEFWQRIFMTVGIVIAVVGMRLIFPIIIVVATAHLGFTEVVNLALYHPEEYGHHLHEAHPAIAAFGGMFLFMIFLDFLLDEGKKIHWLKAIERPLAQAGRLKTLSTLVALTCLMAVTQTWAGEDAERVLMAGVTGLIVYLFVRGLSRLFEEIGTNRSMLPAARSGHSLPVLTGRAAFFSFLYLEVLDASFSFDGVIGAFAITSNVLTIAIGLGIGAIFVRELTIWLVRHQTLQQFRYLEHGAHYAVGALAILLGASLAYNIPEAVTGIIGAVFIALAAISSVLVRRLGPHHTHEVHDSHNA